MHFRDFFINEDTIQDIGNELRAGKLTIGDYVPKVEKAMEHVSGNEHAVATNSCTMALKIALTTLGITRGDRVAVPDITFIACASVVMELGATPVFVDVDPHTYLMDKDAFAEIEGDIDAIIAVRLGGQEVPEWVFEAGNERGAPVIVDSAHSMDAAPFEALATCYSFHPTKIVPGIDGGAITTNVQDVSDLAIQLRLFGFKPGTRQSEMLGYKGNMSNISACLILSQLDILSELLAKRQRVRDLYNKIFGLSYSGLGMYMVTVDHPNELSSYIPCIRHYPLPLSKMTGAECYNPVSDWVADHLLSLPIHERMTRDNVEEVCGIVKPHLITYPV